jgi:type I restriction enzyme S subunit
VSENFPLPSGWALSAVGSVHCDLSQTVNPLKQPETTFELWSIPSFASGAPEFVRGADVGSNKQSVDEGTVLLCGINPRLNRVWVVEPRSSHYVIASTEWIPFFRQSGLNPKYLAYFLQQHEVRDFLASRASGVGGSLMRVKLATIADFPFPVAPQQEQDRIVAEIEALFTDLDAAVAALRRVQANLKRYRASVLKAACEGRLVPTEAEIARKERRTYETGEQLLARILKERRAKWEVDQLAKMLAAGKPPSDDDWKTKYEEPAPPNPANAPDLPKGWWCASFGQLVWAVRSGTAETSGRVVTDYPVLKSSAVRPGRIDFDDLNYLLEGQSSNPDNFVQKGDALITRLSGSLEYVAVCALAERVNDFETPAGVN